MEAPSLLTCSNVICRLYSMQRKSAGKKDENPDIPWLTFKDTASCKFGCCGNQEMHTSNANNLAVCDILSTNVQSTVQQRSAAHSSLLTGCYTTTSGIDIHRVPYDTPADIFLPQKLREAG